MGFFYALTVINHPCRANDVNIPLPNADPLCNFKNKIMTMEQLTLGARIKNCRVQSGISQEALADLTQLSVRTIQRIETGETTARGDSLQRIAKALNIDIKELTSIPLRAANNTTSLKDDIWIIRLLYISALSFLLFPVLGIIFPLILWVIFRKTISGVHQKGKTLILVQTIWCTILFALYVYIGSMKIFHLNLPAPENQKALLLFAGILYAANFIYCVIHLIGSFQIKKYSGQPV